MKYCFIVIDVQKGIFGLKQPVYNQDTFVQNVKRAVCIAREKKIGIIFGQHENSGFLKRGSEGHEIIDDIEINEGDIVIAKKHPDIFTDTGLDELLKKLGVTFVIIAGLISNGCVKDACLSAAGKGYNVILVKDAHSTFYKNAGNIKERINSEMEKAGVRLIPSEELASIIYQ